MRTRTAILILCLAGAAWTCVGAQEFFSRTEDPVPVEVETAYVKGLKFLVTSQSKDGNWMEGQGGEPGVVGLAVLAMLAHGDDPNTGTYSIPIKKGLDFILRRADSRTGYVGSSMYHHGFATLALAEAYGAVDDARIGPALKKAVDLILYSQSQNGAGAWRYSPESQDADTTVSGAQMVALFAARNAGLAVPDEAIRKGLRFYLDCQGGDGGIGYTGPGDSNNTRTSIGVLVMALSRQKDSSAYKSALRFLRRDPFDQAQYPFYHEYYAAQAFFQADPKAWADWNAVNTRRLVAAQNDDGSWDGNQGRTFSTSAALLSLALNYRFLPIYER
jgi:hypothetical protein